MSVLSQQFAADGTGGIYEIDGLTVLAEHRHIALGEQVAEINQGFHDAQTDARVQLEDLLR